MISVSLRDFATTGKFGPIQLGMTRAEVERFLGKPELWGTEKRRDIATIWRYSEIEFCFANHKLHMIFTDHDTLTNGGDTCNIDPWIIRRGLARDELESTLSGDNIEFAVSRPPYDTRQRLVLTAANVQFSIMEDKDPEWPDEELGLFSWNLRSTPIS